MVPDAAAAVLRDEPSLEELYEDAPCGYLSCDAAGVVTRANRTLLRSLGLDAGAVVGRRLADLMAAGSRLYAETHWGPKLELEGAVREVPVDLLRPDGSRLSVLLNAVRITHADGTYVGLRASLFDATDRRRYERDLIAARDTERAARQRVERLQRLSSALSEAVGLDEVAGVLCDAVLAGLMPRRVALVRDGAAWCERREPFPVPGAAVAVSRALDGDTLLVELPADRELSDDDEGFLAACVASGRTALRRARLYAEMEHRALHDALTGLPNTAKLHEELERTLAGGSAVAVALLGLDGFKLLNDTRGHAVGDEVLRSVGARLVAAAGPDDLVARASGDEFVVVSRCTARAAHPLAERLVAAVQAPLALPAGEVFPRVRAGVVVGAAAEGDDAEGLLRDADVALLNAKRDRTGPRHVVFDASMRERAHEHVVLEEGLRRAIDAGELRLHYQPIVRAGDASLVSMEALVRWEHPERGMVSPGAFIPVAEASGLIADIGRWVLAEAAAQLGAWRRAGLVDDRVGVTVNVSVHQLARPELVDDVRAALVAAGLEAQPHLLGLELTETTVMSAAGQGAVERLAQLAALGVRLLLDDFGTGASSLARLRRLPFDTLKIDRAFITGLDDRAGEDGAIVAAVIALAGALDLDVVAEGVETRAQLARLQELGAHEIQGFLYSRPLPAADLTAVLERAQDAGDAAGVVLPLAG